MNIPFPDTTRLRTVLNQHPLLLHRTILLTTLSTIVQLRLSILGSSTLFSFIIFLSLILLLFPCHHPSSSILHYFNSYFFWRHCILGPSPFSYTFRCLLIPIILLLRLSLFLSDYCSYHIICFTTSSIYSWIFTFLIFVSFDSFLCLLIPVFPCNHPSTSSFIIFYYLAYFFTKLST